MKSLVGTFSYLRFFFSFLRWRLLILLGLSIAVGLLDGFGLAMFLPVLELAANGKAGGGSGAMGNLDFLVTGIQRLGFELTLTVVLFAMMALFLLKGVIHYVEGQYKAWLKMLFVKQIRFQMIDGLQKVRYQAFTSKDAGRIQNTLSGEVWRVINSFNHYFLTIQGVILLLTYLLLAFLANPQFAGLVAVGGLLTNLVYAYIYRLTKRLSKDVSSQGHIFQSLIIQGVQYFKYLKATAGLALFTSRLKSSISDLEYTQYRMGKLNALLMASREPLIIVVVVLVILFQVNLLGGVLSTIILSLLFFYRALSSLMQVQNAYNNFLNNIGALENARTFIHELHTDEETEGNVVLENPVDQIKADQLDFAYLQEQTVLSGISLTIEARQTIALVGESGSGKTTLANILAGLIDGYAGELVINGIPLSRLKKSSYQQKIGYITQEAVIFTDTLYNNITFWAPKTPENYARFCGVLRQVALWDFFQDLPQREDTLMGDYGQKVSGGQRQRISIARELFKDIEILIMDEATSALDSETELIVQSSIDQLKGKYTVIVIAHRLSTVKSADKIYLLNQGKIQSSGAFDELLSNSPKFAQMVALQEF